MVLRNLKKVKTKVKKTKTQIKILWIIALIILIALIALAISQRNLIKKVEAKQKQKQVFTYQQEQYLQKPNIIKIEKEPKIEPKSVQQIIQPVQYEWIDVVRLGQCMCEERFSGQWEALQILIMNESGWRYTVCNPSSGAYGLGQALPANKMAVAGEDYLTNPKTQLIWLLDFYIPQRYGNPINALNFWLKNNWY